MSSPVYRKQEQEPASEEVLEVAPNVLRLQLPISLPGLGHVNCYALVDSNGVALVDPGLPGEESWSALMQRLGRAEIPVERVHTVIVTHSHPDHFGGSAQLREVAGAEVLTHESFTSFTAEANEELEPLIDDMTDERSSPCGRNGSKRSVPPPGTRRQPPPDEAILRFVQMGDQAVDDSCRRRRPFGSQTVISPLRRPRWFSIHTPGHAIDHLCLWDPEEGVLSGDHVLPAITLIAGSTQVVDPLATFFDCSIGSQRSRSSPPCCQLTATRSRIVGAVAASSRNTTRSDSTSCVTPPTPLGMLPSPNG